MAISSSKPQNEQPGIIEAEHTCIDSQRIRTAVDRQKALGTRKDGHDRIEGKRLIDRQDN